MLDVEKVLIKIKMSVIKLIWLTFLGIFVFSKNRNLLIIVWRSCCSNWKKLHFPIASNHAKEESEPLRLFPENPNIRSNLQVENLSLRMALFDSSPLYGRGRGFHIEDPDIR